MKLGKKWISMTYRSAAEKFIQSVPFILLSNLTWTFKGVPSSPPWFLGAIFTLCSLTFALLPCINLDQNEAQFQSYESCCTLCHQLYLEKKKDPELGQIQSYIFVQLNLGDDAIRIQSDLTKVYGKSFVSLCMVYKWINASVLGRGTYLMSIGQGDLWQNSANLLKTKGTESYLQE